MSASAVSQALRKLEERLGVVLVQRTSRSVHLTEAGEQLYASVLPALEEVRSAVAAVGELGTAPRGTLRLVVSTGVDPFLRNEVLTGFLGAHPQVRLDVDVSNEITDIVAAGYDAGIRLGEVIDQDMVAVGVSGDVRLVVVGSPSYFARRAKPKHPRDLVAHDCINWHPAPSAQPYRWEFTENGRDFSASRCACSRPTRSFCSVSPARVSDWLWSTRKRYATTSRAASWFLCSRSTRRPPRVLPLLPATTACFTSAPRARRPSAA